MLSGSRVFRYNKPALYDDLTNGPDATPWNPSAIASRVEQVLKYGKNHPYGEVEKIEDINNISTDLCREYYETYFRPNISYLIIVGDIDL